MWRTQRPFKTVPSSAPGVLPEHSVCGVPWDTHDPYPTSATRALLGCPLCERVAPATLPRKILYAELNDLSVYTLFSLSAESLGTALVHIHFSCSYPTGAPLFESPRTFWLAPTLISAVLPSLQVEIPRATLAQLMPNSTPAIPSWHPQHGVLQGP